LSAYERRRAGLVLGAAVLLLAGAVTACHSASTHWVTGASPAAVTPSVAASSAPPSSPPTTKPPTKPSAAGACVAAAIAKMTVRQMAGQVMLVGTPTSSTTSIERAIRKYHIGGVFLSGRSYLSAGALRAEITRMQAAAPAGVRLLVSLDQEGGEVQALEGDDFPPIPTALAQGHLSTSTLSTQTRSWAKRLAAIGVTLDLAPVADTVPASLGTKNPPIGAFHREYGSDPTKVALDIRTVVIAVQSTGVLTTLKHFPGLGRVLVNTDFSDDAVDNVTTVDDPYLDPFIAGIEAKTGAVMISSASYPKLDAHSIATFSHPIVTGLLRDRLGFKGLIVSDSLAGAAAISSVPVSQRGVRFIKAGGDLVLTTTVSKAPAMIDGLIDAANASPSFAAQLKVAATYVMRSKYVAGLLTCSPPKP
jgi:beta-N-acetylhexosaminidase